MGVNPPQTSLSKVRNGVIPPVVRGDSPPYTLLFFFSKKSQIKFFLLPLFAS